MLCLRRCILTQRLCYPATYSASSLHRLLSAAAPAISPSPGFAVEDYLVDTCGLTRAQALKASAQLSQLDPPSNPNAVLAFLAGLGLSGADVAAAVAKDPRLLCAGVERTLVSNVAGLTALGMSRSEIARLVLLARGSFRCRSIVSRVQDNLLLFGSFEGLLRACKLNTNLLACKLERTVKPNVAILRECGLRACDITKLCIPVPWLLTSDVEHVRAMVASTEGIGVPRGSRMFRHALQAVAFFSEEKIAAKVEFLKKTFRWSDADVGIAVSKAPSVLRRSEEMLQRTSDFLILEVGLEPAYIARRPAMLSYSLDGRLRPRYFALKFLKANGLLDSHWGYYSVLVLTEKVFVEKYICPYKEAVPRLAEEYADTCKGPAPTKLRFTHGIKN